MHDCMDAKSNRPVSAPSDVFLRARRRRSSKARPTELRWAWAIVRVIAVLLGVSTPSTSFAADVVTMATLRDAQDAAAPTATVLFASGSLLSTSPQRFVVLNPLARTRTESNYEQTTDCKVTAWWTEERYRVELKGSIDLKGSSSRKRDLREIELFDGSTLISAQFSEGIHPTGAEAHVLPNGKFGPPLSLTAFPFDVRRLGEQAMDFEQVAKVVPDSSITLTSKGNGRWEGRYLLGQGSTILFVADRAAGLNVTSVEGRRRSGELTCKWDLAWRKIGDQWHDVEMTETRFKDKRIQSQHKLRWDKLEPGAKPPADVFSLASLKLPPGSRFLDHRRNARPRERFSVPQTPKNSKIPDDLDDELRLMPR